MIGIRILINVTGTLLLCFSLLIWTFFTNMVSSCSSSSSGCDTQLVEAITVLKLLLLRIVTQLNLNKHETCTFGFSVTNPFLGCHYHKFDIKQVPKTPESSHFKVFFKVIQKIISERIFWIIFWTITKEDCVCHHTNKLKWRAVLGDKASAERSLKQNDS